MDCESALSGQSRYHLDGTHGSGFTYFLSKLESFFNRCLLNPRIPEIEVEHLESDWAAYNKRNCHGGLQQ